MNEQEMKEAMEQWLDNLIEACKIIGTPFNPDPENETEYWETTRCIHVHEPDKALHMNRVDRIANILGLQLYVRYPKVTEDGKELQCFEYYVTYKGYEFFEFSRVSKNYENVKEAKK